MSYGYRLIIFIGQVKNTRFQQEMICVQCNQCPLSSTETDAATKGVAIEATIGVRHVRADWSSLKYPAKANFRIEILNVWPHRNAWALAGIKSTETSN